MCKRKCWCGQDKMNEKKKKILKFLISFYLVQLYKNLTIITKKLHIIILAWTILLHQF